MKILITGSNGFTGLHLKSHFESLGHEVLNLKADLCDRSAMLEELGEMDVEYVIHLAGRSFVSSEDRSAFYSVNVVGTENLLDGLMQNPSNLKRVVLASSAVVYGPQEVSILHEDLRPGPTNHYGCSKLAMEHIAKTYASSIEVVICRMFNYTGRGHAEHFIVPKIVNAFKKKLPVLEVGNINVAREFNDVRDICTIYEQILNSSKIENSEVYNVCSGQAVKLQSIIEYLSKLSGHEIELRVNPAFVRKNDPATLTGSLEKLSQCIDATFNHPIEDTLKWMYEE